MQQLKPNILQPKETKPETVRAEGVWLHLRGPQNAGIEKWPSQNEEELN